MIDWHLVMVGGPHQSAINDGSRALRRRRQTACAMQSTPMTPAI